jgi:hypothetical protein
MWKAKVETTNENHGHLCCNLMLNSDSKVFGMVPPMEPTFQARESQTLTISPSERYIQKRREAVHAAMNLHHGHPKHRPVVMYQKQQQAQHLSGRPAKPYRQVTGELRACFARRTKVYSN